MSPLELHDVFDAALYPQVPKCHSMVPSMTYVSNLHSRARKIPRTRFNPNHHDHDDKRLQTKLWVCQSATKASIGSGRSMSNSQHPPNSRSSSYYSFIQTTYWNGSKAFSTMKCQQFALVLLGLPALGSAFVAPSRVTNVGLVGYFCCLRWPFQPRWPLSDHLSPFCRFQGVAPLTPFQSSSLAGTFRPKLAPLTVSFLIFNWGICCPLSCCRLACKSGPLN